MHQVEVTALGAWLRGVGERHQRRLPGFWPGRLGAGWMEVAVAPRRGTEALELGDGGKMLFLRPLAGNRARSLRPGPAAATGGTDRPLVLRPAHRKIGAGAALFLGVQVTLSPSTTSRPGGDPLLPLLFRPLKPRPRGSFFSVPAVLPHSGPRRLFPEGSPLEKGFFPHFSNRKKPRGGPGV